MLTREKAIDGIRFFTLTGLPVKPALKNEFSRALNPRPTDEERVKLYNIQHEAAMRRHNAPWN